MTNNYVWYNTVVTVRYHIVPIINNIRQKNSNPKITGKAHQISQLSTHKTEVKPEKQSGSTVNTFIKKIKDIENEFLWRWSTRASISGSSVRRYGTGWMNHSTKQTTAYCIILYRISNWLIRLNNQDLFWSTLWSRHTTKMMDTRQC